MFLNARNNFCFYLLILAENVKNRALHTGGYNKMQTEFAQALYRYHAVKPNIRIPVLS